MDITTTLETLKLTIGNPASRKIIKSLSKFCNSCNKNRIEVAIELYTGIRKNSCLKCKLAEKAIDILSQKKSGDSKNEDPVMDSNRDSKVNLGRKELELTYGQETKDHE